MAQWERICLTMQETRVQSLGWEDPLEKEMATHYSILSWEIPRIEELGGLQSMGSKESDMIELLSTHVRSQNKPKTEL